MGSAKIFPFKVIDEEKPWLQRAKREVETQAKKMLIQGLENLVGVVETNVAPIIASFPLESYSCGCGFAGIF